MDGAASTLPLIVINLMFAGIALAVGFAAGAWFLGSKPRTSKEQALADPEGAKEQALAAERTAMASSRLRDLASGVATDVGEHNSRVEEITAGLEAAKQGTDEQKNAEVTAALAKIVEANEQLQSKLAKAEEQIQAQAQEIRAHESEARTDSLTQLANRRAFDDHLEQRFAEWTRKATPFSLIILDVDHFKKFNDTHGHQAGDEVLRHVARALEDAARDMDIPCRYGGEEFGIILPATIAKDATGLVERARKAIDDRRIQFEGKTLSVTASFGLAQVTAADDCDRLLKRADEALYAAKDAGRNRGYLHDGTNCLPVVGGAGVTKAVAPAAEKVATRTLDRLPNRTRFAEELRRYISASERSGEPLSVVAIRVPGYEELREEYGDAVALLTLDSLAMFLNNTLREMDLLGRVDESQFALMLPTATAADAHRVATRAVAALGGCAVPIGDDQLQLEAEMGVAQLHPDDTAASLMNRAIREAGCPVLAVEPSV
ncbi:MAG: diguanylate cyclase [Planctomycetota bacterium]